MTEHSPTFKKNGLIRWFIANPVAANLLMLILIIGGALATSNLRSQVFPTISPSTVSVTVPFPGATPAEVEEGVTRRIEEAVLGIDGVKRVRSSASENVGTVTVELASFADLQLVKDDIQSAVDGLSDFPPENADRPTVQVPSGGSDVVTLAVMGNVSTLELRQAAEELERDLLTQPGISLVGLAGDRDYEISIEVSEDTLQRYNLSFSEVAAAVRATSLDLAGGSITTQGGEILLRTNQKRQAGAEFGSVVVRTDTDGSQLLLSDIAVIRDGFSRTKLTNTYNGKPAIFVEVARAEAEDVLKVKTAVDNLMIDYKLPNGIKVEQFRDRTQLLKERVNLLLRNALFGFALVFLFLVLMLDLKLAVWVSAGITTAFMGAFLFFDVLGVTITMVSLFGLIIVLGLVVDDAIVIGENIDAERRAGKTGSQAAIDGVQGVFAPVLVGVLTSIAAFSPLLFVGGGFGDIARPIPIVVICVLVVSLVEAFFILPSHLGHGTTWSTGPLRWTHNRISQSLRRFSAHVVEPCVKFCARWRYATAGGAIAFVIVCFGLMSSGTVKFVFFPTIEGNDLSTTIVMPEGTPFERTDEVVKALVAAANAVAEDAVNERGEELFLSMAVTSGGNKGAGGGPQGTGSFAAAENIGQVQIELVPYGARRTSAKDIERAWREKLGDLEGVERISYTGSIGNFGDDIEFELAHEDEASLIAASEALKTAIKDLAGANQIKDSFDTGKRQFVFKLTPAGLAAGLQPSDIARQVRQAFFGDEVQRIQRGREEVRVYVRYPNQARNSLSSLESFRLRLANGISIPLSTVAEIDESRAYSSINRIDGRRIVTVTADIDELVSTAGIANTELVNAILPKIEAQYPGLRWTQAGASREQNEDFASLGRAFIIVLLVIFAMLATQLRSYIQPIAILVSIPLAISGAILGHLVLGYALSFVSIFGIVALSGVAVNASVVLIDFYNKKRADGYSSIDAAAEASARRFRPILLTTLTTALGLAPLLFEKSPQAQFLIPMAVSLGFGIVISGFMVIFVTPAVALIIEDIKRAGIHLTHRVRRSPEP